MKKIAMYMMLVAGMVEYGAFAEVSVSKDSGYVGTIVLEDFNGTSDPATGKQQLVLESIGEGIATYGYPTNSSPEGYASFNPTSVPYDPSEYTSIRTRMYVERNAGWDGIQFYPHPFGPAGSITRALASGTVLREQQFDLSAMPDDGIGVRLDPFNYVNDAVVDRWAIDYFMADRGSTKGVEFDHAGDFAGVTYLNMISATVSNGMLLGTSDADAQIHLHNGLDLNNASADIYKYVEIRMKGSGDQVELFWRSSAISEIQKVVLDVAADGSAYHTYLVDFSGEAGWSGTIEYLRLDPNKTPGADFELDYVRLLSTGPLKIPATSSLLFTLVGRQPPVISHGPMLGAVSATNAKVWIRTTVPADAVFTLTSLSSGGELPSRIVSTTAESDNTGVVDFGNLIPDTEYQYEVVVGESSHRGVFTTLGDSLTNRPIRLVYGYGYEPDEDMMPPGTSIYMDMKERNADLVIFLGDFPYTQLGAREELIEGNKELRSIVGFTELTDSTPTYGIYDDHDFGPNDCDGTHTNADIALETFKDYWANPSYGSPTNKGIYSSFVVGDVEIFLLDGRYQARKEEHTMLGTVQFDWLCNRLESSTSRLKVLVSGTQFGRVKDDGWPGEYYIDERTRLFDFIRDHGISGVFGISGDVHRNDIYKLPIGGNRFFYDLTPGSLARHHRSAPASFPPGLIYSYGPGDKDNMFGEIDFLPATGTNAAIVFRNFSGLQGMTYEFTLSMADLDAEGDDIGTWEMDPTNALPSYSVLGDWNTDGDFEGWVCNSNFADCVVSGGALAGTAGDSNKYFDLELASAEKYVSLSPGSTLEIRCRYEAGTSNSLGECFLNDDFWRLSFITNAESQPVDGDFHIYRTEISQSVSDLATFRLAPFAAGLSGERFEVDYIHVESARMIDPIDAPGTVFDYASLAEWNTDGDFEGWGLNNIGGQSVSNGVLAGTGINTGDCQIQKSTDGGLLPLDLDRNKILEFKIKSDVATTALTIYYATEANPDLSELQRIDVTGVLIPQDGEFHVYRLDLTSESLWEGTLKTFRMDPATTIGATFEVDYIRVGTILE